MISISRPRSASPSVSPLHVALPLRAGMRLETLRISPPASAPRRGGRRASPPRPDRWFPGWDGGGWAGRPARAALFASHVIHAEGDTLPLGRAWSATESSVRAVEPRSTRGRGAAPPRAAVSLQTHSKPIQEVHRGRDHFNTASGAACRSSSGCHAGRPAVSAVLQRSPPTTDAATCGWRDLRRRLRKEVQSATRVREFAECESARVQGASVRLRRLIASRSMSCGSVDVWRRSDPRTFATSHFRTSPAAVFCQVAGES